MVRRPRQATELVAVDQKSLHRNRSAEEDLRDSQARLRSVLDMEIDAIIVIDEKGIIESVNPSFTRLFGYPPEEVVGENVSLLMPEPYRTEHDGYLVRYLTTGKPRIIGTGRDVKGRRKDGTTFPIELSVSEMWLGQRRMFTGIARDLSEREKAEEKFRLAVQAAPYGMVMIDSGGRIVLVNSEAERMFGYARDELVGQPIEVLVPPRFRAKHAVHRGAFFEVPIARPMGADRDLWGLRKDGTEFPVEIGLSPVVTNTGTMVLSSIVDITERNRAHEELEETQRILWTLMSNVPGMAYRCPGDGDGAAEFVSDGSFQLTGYEPLQLIGDGRVRLAQLVHPEDREQVSDQVRAALKRGEPFRLVYRLITASGEEKWVWEHGCGVYARDGALLAVEGFIGDMSEQKDVERKLVEKESLAKLGELSAIVAHEVKNPLAGIAGAARMLKRRLPEGSVESEVCEEMIDRTENLTRGVNDILAYSRFRIPRLQAVPLEALLEDTVAFLARDPQFEGIDVDLSVRDDVLVSCDADMLKPVLLNILVNAAQAMAGKGRIRIDVEAGNPSCTITVHDSGPGIPDDALQRIFEPFFTTKGGGTGLGLPIAKRTVGLHGGTIRVDCPPAGGTKVVIEIPTTNHKTVE